MAAVNQAIRGLREHVKQSQQVFATELGISISALNNYEQKRIPELKKLFAFERAAIKARRDDLALIFNRAIKEGIGLKEWRAR